MYDEIKSDIWRQFGASIDALGGAIEMCPDGVWDNERKFWYNAYHCLFWTDYYLTLEPESFEPPPPFTLSEFDPDGEMPPSTYNKNELLAYLGAIRTKCRDLIADLDEETARRRWVNANKDYSVIEILLYNMRHVQHHAAQLNLILRQEIGDAAPWVSRANDSLP